MPLDTAIDVFAWFEDAFSAAKWSSVAQQAGVIFAALDDVDIQREFRTICHAYDDKVDEDSDCDGAGAEVSQESLLWTQVFFDVARSLAQKVAVALA
jgi:hypothetical protein